MTNIQHKTKFRTKKQQNNEHKRPNRKKKDQISDKRPNMGQKTKYKKKDKM